MSKRLDTPQLSATIDLIKEAVGRIPVAGDLEELGLRPRICGVYFLLYRGQVVYVGQSKDVVGRINRHVDEHLKDFDRVLYIPCPSELLDYYEKRLIVALRPKYNIGPRGAKTGAAALVVRVLAKAPNGLTFEEILGKAEEQGTWAQTRSSLQTNLRRALERNPHIRFCEENQRYRIEHPALGEYAVQNTEISSAIARSGDKNFPRGNLPATT